jgi:hypothetical protein
MSAEELLDPTNASGRKPNPRVLKAITVITMASSDQMLARPGKWKWPGPQGSHRASRAACLWYSRQERPVPGNATLA